MSHNGNVSKRTNDGEGSAKRLRRNEDTSLSDMIDSESEKEEWSDLDNPNVNAMAKVVSLKSEEQGNTVIHRCPLPK